MKVTISGMIAVKDHNLNLLDELSMDLEAFSYIEYELLSDVLIKDTIVIMFTKTTIECDLAKLTKDMLDFINYLNKSYNTIKANIKLNNTYITK